MNNGNVINFDDLKNAQNSRVNYAPVWWENTNHQIATVKEFLKLFGGEAGFTPDDIPPPPTNFTPKSPTEILMLAVYLPNKGRIKAIQRNFDSWWNFITPPEGFSKWCWSKLKSSPKSLRYVPGIKKTPGIRWIGYDPETYVGYSPDEALEYCLKDGLMPAGEEVLVATALFPKIIQYWDDRKFHFPHLSSYQFKCGGYWQGAPYLFRQDDSCQLELDVYWCGGVFSNWASPIIREL